MSGNSDVDEDGEEEVALMETERSKVFYTLNPLGLYYYKLSVMKIVHHQCKRQVRNR